MVTKEEEKVNNQDEDQDLNPEFDMFDYDQDKIDDEEIEQNERDLDLDGVEPAEDASAPDPEEEDDEEGEEDDELFTDESEDEIQDDELSEDELASFNKKLNTDFKTAQELKDFLNKGDQKEAANTEEADYEKASNTLEWYEPILKLNDADLMREQYKSIAIGQKKDINDEEVQDEIEDQVQELIDSKTLSLHAKSLRDDIQRKVVDPAKEQKSKIEKARTDREVQKKQSEKEEVQNALADIFKSKNFFGLEPDKEKISQAYKDISSGKFLTEIASDRKALAELAMMRLYKEEIYKKSSGLNYNDGIGAVLNDYKAKNKKTGTNPVVAAQRKGSIASSDKSEGLLSALIK